MSSSRNNRNLRNRKREQYKRRKKIFIIEVVTLVVLSVVLFAAIWFAKKMSLVNHTELDTSKVMTADDYNKQNSESTQTASASSQSASSSSGSAESEAAATSSSSETAEETDSGLSGIDIFALVGLDSRPEDPEVKNSDTMIICVMNHNTKTIKLCSIMRDTYLNVIYDYYGNPNYYMKANAAYNYGGAEQFLSMINLNLDLNITEFMTVDFTALADVIDLLGGLDIDMTKQELIHMNDYNVETSEICGVEYEEIPVPDDPYFDGYVTKTFHCTGSQAVSYARIRYTAGYDFKRASRQREVLSLIKEKASTADLGTIDSILNTVLPQVTTNIDNMKLLTLATSVLSYELDEDDQTGFPFVHAEDDGSLTGTDCVIPVTLAYNVEQLHAFLFPDEEYTPSETVQEFSYAIATETGWTDEWIETAAQQGDLADQPTYTEEEYLQALEEGDQETLDAAEGEDTTMEDGTEDAAG